MAANAIDQQRDSSDVVPAGRASRGQRNEDRQRRPRIARVIALAGGLAAAAAIVGCGGAGAIARNVGVAACRQAASSLSDPHARQIGDQACQAGATGDLSQSTKAAKQAARDACLQEARKLVDPAARQQIEALCPTVN